MTELSKATFNYTQLDGDTADFLRQKETNMREIVGKAYTELGRELYEAQQELRKQGSKDGVFMAWYKSLGFTPKQVSRLIQRYELLTNCQEPEKELIEDLPVSLTYEIAKPSAEATPAKAQAKAEVLAGEIETLKEYRERIAEIERKAEEAEKRADVERQIRERLEEQVDDLSEREKQARQEALSAREELERTKEANPFSEEPYGVKLGLAMYDAFDELSKWQKEYSWVITDKTEFQKLVESNPNFAREFNRLDKFWQQMSAAFHGVRNKGTYSEEHKRAEIIEADFSEVL